MSKLSNWGFNQDNLTSNLENSSLKEKNAKINFELNHVKFECNFFATEAELKWKWRS